MKKKSEEILKKVLEKVKPSEKEMKEVQDELKKFLIVAKENIKKNKIDAEIFIGGSFAKETLIKKRIYDLDIFLRFSQKYAKEDISKLTEKILNSFKELRKIHGSRDYFKIKVNDFLVFEIVPVIKVNKPKDAYNITDLSYSHVKYINKKIKSKKILDEIRLAKAFCYANEVYGAESHIKGFSGYSLELLVIYYKGFLNFLKAMSKIKEKKTIIDIEKLYKDKNQVLRDINESKLESPIILIDPTHKYRNALAALSNETFEKFKKEAVKFLKAPSEKFFETKKKDFESIKRDYKRKGYESEILEIKTEKQEGAIAGSKLLKFYNYLVSEISKKFDIKEKDFDYGDKKSARIIFSAKRKKEIKLIGPEKKDKENAERFREKHSGTSVVGDRLYCIIGVDCTLEDFLNNWIKDNKRKLNEMSISWIEVVE